MRRSQVVLLVIMAALIGAPAAIAGTVRVPGSIVTLTGEQGVDCNTVIAVEVPAIHGITTYTAYVTDTVYHETAANPGTYSTSAPFSGDTIVYGSTFIAPAGEHYIGLAGTSGPGCDPETGRFSLLRVVGTTAGGHLVDGRVTNGSGHPVAGVSVEAHCSGGGSTSTDASGDYGFILPDGNCEISPHPADGSVAVPASRTVDVSGTVHNVDFTVRGDELSLSFSPASVAANGTGEYAGGATDVNADGAPVVGKALTFAPPLDVSPRALVCAKSGLVYPRTFSDGSPDGAPFSLNIDSGGLVPLSVWVGTTPGDWLLDGDESAEPSVSASISLPFGASSGASFSPGLVPEQFYEAARQTIGGPSAINLFHNLGAIGESEASNQAVLLAFLGTVASKFPGSDFGPVNAGGLAGVVFYPHGSADPSNGSVLSVDQAADIIEALASNQPIPAADASLLPLSVWAAQHGSTAAATLGFLVPPPGANLEYFGFPYPPLATSAGAQVSFYGPCLAPDPALQEVQTHSPVTLEFSGAGGDTFGLNASGHAIGTGAGFVARTGDVTTYVVPAGSYSVAITGTGSGPATLVSIAPGKRSDHVQTFSFHVRRREHGSLALTAAGARSVLHIGSAKARAATGLPLTISGAPRAVRRGRRTRVELVIRDLGSPVSGATITVSGAARGGAITGATGRAKLSVRPRRGGRLRLTITAPGAKPVSRSIRVR